MYAGHSWHGHQDAAAQKRQQGGGQALRLSDLAIPAQPRRGGAERLGLRLVHEGRAVCAEAALVEEVAPTTEELLPAGVERRPVDVPQHSVQDTPASLRLPASAGLYRLELDGAEAEVSVQALVQSGRAHAPAEASQAEAGTAAPAEQPGYAVVAQPPSAAEAAPLAQAAAEAAGAAPGAAAPYDRWSSVRWARRWLKNTESQPAPQPESAPAARLAQAAAGCARPADQEVLASAGLARPVATATPLCATDLLLRRAGPRAPAVAPPAALAEVSPSLPAAPQAAAGSTRPAAGDMGVASAAEPVGPAPKVHRWLSAPLPQPPQAEPAPAVPAAARAAHRAPPLPETAHRKEPRVRKAGPVVRTTAEAARSAQQAVPEAAAAAVPEHGAAAAAVPAASARAEGRGLLEPTQSAPESVPLEPQARRQVLATDILARFFGNRAPSARPGHLAVSTSAPQVSTEAAGAAPEARQPKVHRWLSKASPAPLEASAAAGPPASRAAQGAASESTVAPGAGSGAAATLEAEPGTAAAAKPAASAPNKHRWLSQPVPAAPDRAQPGPPARLQESATDVLAGFSGRGGAPAVSGPAPVPPADAARALPRADSAVSAALQAGRGSTAAARPAARAATPHRWLSQPVPAAAGPAPEAARLKPVARPQMFATDVLAGFAGRRALPAASGSATVPPSGPQAPAQAAHDAAEAAQPKPHRWLRQASPPPPTADTAVGRPAQAPRAAAEAASGPAAPPRAGGGAAAAATPLARRWLSQPVAATPEPEPPRPELPARPQVLATDVLARFAVKQAPVSAVPVPAGPAPGPASAPSAAAAPGVSGPAPSPRVHRWLAAPVQPAQPAEPAVVRGQQRQAAGRSRGAAEDCRRAPVAGSDPRADQTRRRAWPAADQWGPQNQAPEPQARPRAPEQRTGAPRREAAPREQAAGAGVGVAPAPPKKPERPRSKPKEAPKPQPLVLPDNVTVRQLAALLSAQPQRDFCLHCFG